MAATLDCIGISAGSPGQLNDWLTKWAAATREVHRHEDVSHSLWRDYSGAAVGIHVDKGRVVCITPWFSSPEGSTKWFVESAASVIDPQCLDCSGADVHVLDERGEPVTRASIQFLFFRPWREWLAAKRRYRIEVAAFAEKCEIITTPHEGFVPIGQDQGPLRARARAVFAGPVRHVARRENTVTGEKFVQMRIATPPGEIDVVHPATLQVEAGQTARVAAWIVGRPVDKPPPPKSWWRKLVRK